jgi:hypothetical protein
MTDTQHEQSRCPNRLYGTDTFLYERIH